VLLGFVVLGLLSLVPSQEIGWEECLQSDLTTERQLLLDISEHHQVFINEFV